MFLSQIIEKWLREVHAVNVKASTHAGLKNAIENHLMPKIDGLDESVSAQKLLVLLNEIPPAATRKRILGALKNAIDYAVICGHMTHNPAASLNNYIKKSDYVYTPYAVLPKQQWAKFFYDIEHMPYSKTTKVLFWAIAYTALRRAEATQALKSEFDFNVGTWTVPASRMKNKSEHIVYLAPTLQLMLVELFNSNNSLYAFPSPQKGGEKPLANWTTYQILRKSDYVKKQTLHGLRKIFSSHAHESLLFSIDAVEISIDHKIAGVRGIYNVAKYEAERRQLARWYGLELDKWRGLS